MKRLFSTLLAIVVAAGLFTTSCSSTASNPSPTKADTTPTKVSEPAKGAEPTKAPAPAQSAAVSTNKVDFPQKGKTITVIVPWPAGGANDLGARILSSLLEKELGTSVQVVNKPGANGQIGITEAIHSKPDGYTVIVTALPSTMTLYLDPEHPATFTRDDLVPVALHTMDPVVIAVKAESPFKDMKDVIAAAKANPEKVKAGTGTVLNVSNLATMGVQQAAGAKFAMVQFDGGSQIPIALLGDHVDIGFDMAGTFVSHVKNGKLRVVGVMGTERNKFLPDVPTLEEQGLKVYGASSRGWSVPKGTPKEVVDTLSSAIKRAMDNPEHQKKMEELGLGVRYMDATQFGEYWKDMEDSVKPLLELYKQQ